MSAILSQPTQPLCVPLYVDHTLRTTPVNLASNPKYYMGYIWPLS